MKCPACSEINEGGMQFCIFCGQSLAPAPAPVQVVAPLPAPAPLPVVAPIEEMRATSNQMMVLVCTLCSKSDPLNGQFCVYCGGRTIAAPLPYQGSSGQNFAAVSGSQAFGASSQAFGPSSQNFGTSSQAFGPSSQNFGPSSQNFGPTSQQTAVSAPDIRHSEEYVRNASPQAKSSGFPVIAAVLLAIIFGAGAGVGAVYFAKSEVEKSALKSLWPAEGLLIFSNAPDAKLSVADKNSKSFVFGRLSSKGTLQLPTITPGDYKLTISDENDKEVNSEFSSIQGSANVLGYPSRLEIK